MHKYMGGGHRGWLVLIHLFAYRDSNNENKLYWYLVFCAQWSVINLISSIKLQIFSLSVGEKSTKPSINFYIYQPSIYTIADKLKCFKKKKAILKLCCSFFHIPWPFYLWRQKISTCRDLEHFSFKKKIFRKKIFFSVHAHSCAVMLASVRFFVINHSDTHEVYTVASVAQHAG